MLKNQPTNSGLCNHSLVVVFGCSGDADSVVPVTGTRYALAALKLPVVVPWYPWYHKKQVSCLLCFLSSLILLKKFELYLVIL